jgi:hypothetical protein
MPSPTTRRVMPLIGMGMVPVTKVASVAAFQQPSAVPGDSDPDALESLAVGHSPSSGSTRWVAGAAHRMMQ